MFSLLNRKLIGIDIEKAFDCVFFNNIFTNKPSSVNTRTLIKKNNQREKKEMSLKDTEMKQKRKNIRE